MARPIPVQNIYYLLLYAWNRLPEGRTVDVTGIHGPELPNLVAKVLVEGVRNLLRRGLDRGYVQSDEELMRPRGRIRISETLSRNLLSRAEVACTTDELSRDVLHNQIIKVTLERLSRTVGIDSSIRERIISTLSGLTDIRSILLVARDFGRTQLHGNNAFYGFLLRVCALAHEALIPDPRSGRFHFREILTDPQTMGRIFQDFVRNFFRLEQTRFAVRGDQFKWPIETDVGRGHQLMPTMNTDVSLRDGNRTIIVECKWTPTTLQVIHGAQRLRSEHLYQLNAYMTHHPQQGKAEPFEGLLLYPQVDQPVDVALKLNAGWMRVRTINLYANWHAIRDQLLGLLETPSA